jgi:hypothetical protein
MADDITELTIEVRRLTARLNDTIKLLYNMEKRIDKSIARRINQNSAPTAKGDSRGNKHNIGAKP